MIYQIVNILVYLCLLIAGFYVLLDDQPASRGFRDDFNFTRFFITLATIVFVGWSFLVGFIVTCKDLLTSVKHLF